MRCLIIVYIFLSFNVFGQTKNNEGNAKVTPNSDTKKKQKDTMPDYSPTFDKAHPNAKRLMKEDFYFSTIDETAPFGNDDGADTYAGFRDWRQTHKSDNPKGYLLEQLDSWGYPKYDIYETDIEKLTPYLKQNSLGSRYISGVDAAIIAIAFGQLCLEGAIDKDFNELAKIAIERQLNPELLELWGDPYKIEREIKLRKMLAILNS